MYHNSLNQDSLTKINNIVRGFKAIPMYQKYEINSYLYDAKEEYMQSCCLVIILL